MNLKKFKLNVTIKRMLNGLVLTGVAVTVILSVTTLYSNNKLIESQRSLTSVVMPLNNANQDVNEALNAFTIRKYVISVAKSLKEVAIVEDRKRLEQTFAESLQHLKQSSERADAPEAGQTIQTLESLYRKMLDKDALLLASIKKRISMDSDIRAQMTEVDGFVGKLRKNMEGLSDKLAAQEQESLNRLKLVSALLSDYSRRVMTAEDPAQIKAIKIEWLIPTFETSDRAIEALKTAKPETVSEIETDLKTLRTIIMDGERSLLELKNLWLEEEKTIEGLNRDLDTIASSLAETLKTLQMLANRVRTQAEQQALNVSTTGKLILIVAGIAILMMIFMGGLIVRRIINPINKVVLFADTISKGDLTAEIQQDYNDEIGSLVSKLSEMAHSLNSLIGQVQRSGIQVTSSATELSATSKQQEAVMKTQLESTNDVVKSVEEISNVSAELVETMKRVAAMSDQTAEFANRGQTDLAQMEEAMRHMEDASKSISAKLEAINEKAANITSVVTTITKVADQTNLLSLNAAIEAEKAGEYGRGFTVVAREIRRLADQTAVATLDIDQMVQEMQSAVSAGVMEMDAFIAEVQKSAENVGKISNQLTRIIQQVQALSPSFEEVNESMQIQSGNAQQINSSMAHLSEEMQQTMESLRESFLAIEQLNDAAKGLQDEVSRFRVI